MIDVMPVVLESPTHAGATDKQQSKQVTHVVAYIPCSDTGLYVRPVDSQHYLCELLLYEGTVEECYGYIDKQIQDIRDRYERERSILSVLKRRQRSAKVREA